MRTQYLPLFKQMHRIEHSSRFGGHFGGGVSFYARGNDMRSGDKVKVEINWSSYGSMDPRQAMIFQKNLSEAINIAKRLSGKLTYQEFSELQHYVNSEFWDTKRTAGPTALGRLF